MPPPPPPPPPMPKKPGSTTATASTSTPPPPPPAKNNLPPALASVYAVQASTGVPAGPPPFPGGLPGLGAAAPTGEYATMAFSSPSSSSASSSGAKPGGAPPPPPPPPRMMPPSSEYGAMNMSMLNAEPPTYGRVEPVTMDTLELSSSSSSSRRGPPPGPPAPPPPRAMGNAAGESVYGTMAPIIGAPPTGGMRRQRSRSFGDSAGAPGGPTPYASLPRHMADTAKSNAAAATPLPAKIGVSASERAAGGFSRMSQSRGTLTRSNRFNNKGRSGTMAFDSSTMSTMSTFNSPIGGGGGTRDLAMSSGTMAFGGPPSSGTMAFGGPPSRPPLAPPPSSGAPMFATMSRISGSGGGGGAALPPPIAMSATRALPPGPPPGAPPLESRISRMPEMPMLVVRASQGVLVDESGAEISLLGLLSDASTAIPMLKALCKAALFDERTLLESVCRGLDPHNVLRSVLHTAIDAEMADVGVGSNVFRDTVSPASMLLCTYATLVAKAYIIDTCRAFLDELARDRTASDYNNLTNVERWSTSLLDTAAASLYDCPPTLAWLLNAIRNSSSRRFSSSPTVSVARFFFLRIICPALMVPVGAGVLTSEPTKAVARAVRQVCKVMKALANATTFKNDVPMIPLNGYVQANTQRMADICDMVSTDTPPLGATPSLATLADADAVHLKYVRDLMQRRLTQVEQSLNDVALIRKVNAYLNA